MKPVKRILFITLSNIGDAILTTPALEALHHAFPDATIDIVGDARSDIVFRHCPYRGELFLKRKKEGWKGLFRLIRLLRRQRYDLAVDLRTDGLLWALRADRRISKLPSRVSHHLHSAEKHFLAVHPVTGGEQAPGTKIWVSPYEHEQAAHFLGDATGQRILALGPGANWPPKIWPASHFAALANLLQARFDAILLLGNQQDQTRALEVAEKVQLPCINACGKTDLLVAAALLEQCVAFVGNDSGLGHIASAVGIPTLTVFGPGEPQRYRPWNPQGAWLQSESRDIADVSPQQAADAMNAVLPPKES